jgi:aminopeptidase C
MANLYKREPRETVDGRLMNFLLKAPIIDGGQWDMVVNIIKKHGILKLIKFTQVCYMFLRDILDFTGFCT